MDLAECCNSSQRENTDKSVFASFVFWEKHAVMINMLASTITSRKYIASANQCCRQRSDGTVSRRSNSFIDLANGEIKTVLWHTVVAPDSSCNLIFLERTRRRRSAAHESRAREPPQEAPVSDKPFYAPPATRSAV